MTTTLEGDMPILTWNGPDSLRDPGIRRLVQTTQRRVFRVPGLPIFTANRFPQFREMGPAEILGAVSERIEQWIGGLPVPDDSCTVAYTQRTLHTPGANGSRAELYYIVSAFGPSPGATRELIEYAAGTFERTFPSELYRLSEVGDPATIERVLGLERVAAVASLLRLEHEQQPTNPDCPADFFYTFQDWSARRSDRLELFQAWPPDHQPVTRDVTLVPTRLNSVEEQVLSKLVDLLDEWAAGPDDRSILEDTEASRRPGEESPFAAGRYRRRRRRRPRDEQAEAAQRFVRDLLERFRGRPLYLFSVKAMASDRPAAAECLGRVQASHLAENCSRTFVTHQGEPGFDRLLADYRGLGISPMECWLEFWTRGRAPQTLRRLGRLADESEISSFFGLPVPIERPCPGVAVDDGVLEQPTGNVRADIVLGRDRSEETIRVPIANLAKHALVVGVPGSGKTRTCSALLTRLWSEHRIPFLVLEPRKKEYRNLASLPGMEDLTVFTLHSDAIAPFRLNPFRVPDGVPLETHLSQLLSCFEGAFSLEPFMVLVLEQALRRAYVERGWSLLATGADDAPPTPGFADLSVRIEEETERYEGELQSNLRGALGLRIDALRHGSRGRVFETRHGLSPALLFERPVVIEMDGLRREDIALFCLFILTQLAQYARGRAHESVGLDHVTLLEEAHAVIGAGSDHAPQSHGQQAATALVTDMLAEMRALGEGIVIADQLPSAIAPEAVKNTSLKVVHRLTAGPDREAIGETMTLTEHQSARLPVFIPGQAMVYREGWGSAREVVMRDLDQEPAPVGDDIVAARSERLRREAPAAFLPMRACVLHGVCDGVMRDRAERLAQQLSERLESIEWREESDPARRAAMLADHSRAAAAQAIADNGAGLTGRAAELAYCVHVHRLRNDLAELDDDPGDGTYPTLLSEVHRLLTATHPNPDHGGPPG